MFIKDLIQRSKTFEKKKLYLMSVVCLKKYKKFAIARPQSIRKVVMKRFKVSSNEY